MRKAAAVLLIALILVGLNGCSNGHGKPKEVSDNTYNTTIKIIEVIDEYLDFEIDAKEALERFKRLENRLDRSGVNSEDTPIHQIGRASCRERV